MSTRQKKRPLFSLMALLFAQQFLNIIKCMEDYGRTDLPRSHSLYIFQLLSAERKKTVAVFRLYGFPCMVDTVVKVN